MSESHTLMDGKLHVYHRENSRFWQCATFLAGRNHRSSSKETNISYALEFARDWYLDRLAEDRLRRRGIVLTPTSTTPAVPVVLPPAPQSGEKTFREAADAFQREYEALTRGERNEIYVASKGRTIRLYLLPFFGDLPLSQVTAGLIQEYRLQRVTPPAAPERVRYVRNGRERVGKVRIWKRPSRQTLHNEIVCLRQILKTSNRKGWIPAIPDMSSPYRPSGKISHRAWFSPEEYRQLYEATRARAKHPKKERWRAESEKFHDYVLFMANTGLRPDEASRLEFRDVTVVEDHDTNERILEIEVRGKRGVGYCKSMSGAVLPFERLRKRVDPKPRDVIFGPVQRELLNAILEELDLKKDREGNPRTAYSLRHTYISMRLMEGADIYQVAKNCRTSVEMIEKYYASHIKNTLDASAINVRKPKPAKPRAAEREATEVIEGRLGSEA